MNQGLFESLTGRFLDGTPLESVPTMTRGTFSIMDHLNRMFNTRAGSLSHLPDYGLPDISEIYRRMPRGTAELQQAIKRAVEMFEPRLTNIRVIPGESEDQRFRIQFIISAQLANGARVRFQTTFTSTGNSIISPWKSRFDNDRQIL